MKMCRRISVVAVFMAMALIGVSGVACGSPTLTTSISPSAGGSISPAGGTYDKGVAVNVTAVPSSGYRFDHWEGGASGESPKVSLMMDGKKKITAYFTKVYTLSASASPSGGGNISPSVGTYDTGNQVTLIAVPALYYKFNGWSGDASGNSDHLTLTMDSAKSVVASFVKITYPIQTQVDTSGGGTVSPNSGTFEAGTQVKITATPGAGFRFYKWGGDASGTANPTSLLVDGDRTVTASFMKVWRLTVLSSPSDGGSINVKDGLYDSGAKASLTAIPSFPNYLKSWTGTGNNSTNTTTVTVTADTVVTAIFAPCVPGETKKASGAVSIDGNGRWGPLVSVPIQLNQFEWVQGEIIFQTPNTPNTPVRAYVQDPAGNTVKDFGSTRQTNFDFMAQTAGKYTAVFQNNSIWYADYYLTYTVYGLPK